MLKRTNIAITNKQTKKKEMSEYKGLGLYLNEKAQTQTT